MVSEALAKGRGEGYSDPYDLAMYVVEYLVTNDAMDLLLELWTEKDMLYHDEDDETWQAADV